MKSFNAMLSTYFKCILSGFTGLFLSSFLVYGGNHSITVPLALGFSFLIFFFSIFVSLFLFLLPLLAQEKEMLQRCSPRQLMDRYFPFISIPLFIVFCLILFLGWEAKKIADLKEQTSVMEAHRFLLTAIVIGFCMSSGGLWVFIKKMKS